MKAVVLAGGKGTRLKPYTTSLPKPLMPIGERPVPELALLLLFVPAGTPFGFDELMITLLKKRKKNSRRVSYGVNC